MNASLPILYFNAELVKKPETVNQDPYGRGWMVVVTLDDAAQLDALMSAPDYERFIADAGH